MPTLAQLKGGIRARIKAIHGEGESSARLNALGLLPGREIRLRHTAPLGDPRAFEIDGQKISIRLTEAALVEIEEIGESGESDESRAPQPASASGRRPARS